MVEPRAMVVAWARVRVGVKTPPTPRVPMVRVQVGVPSKEEEKEAALATLQDTVPVPFTVHTVPVEGEARVMAGGGGPTEQGPRWRRVYKQFFF